MEGDQALGNPIKCGNKDEPILLRSGAPRVADPQFLQAIVELEQSRTMSSGRTMVGVLCGTNGFGYEARRTRTLLWASPPSGTLVKQLLDAKLVDYFPSDIRIIRAIELGLPMLVPLKIRIVRGMTVMSTNLGNTRQIKRCEFVVNVASCERVCHSNTHLMGRCCFPSDSTTEHSRSAAEACWLRRTPSMEEHPSPTPLKLLSLE